LTVIYQAVPGGKRPEEIIQVTDGVNVKGDILFQKGIYPVFVVQADIFHESIDPFLMRAALIIYQVPEPSRSGTE
jgi:hypothetical protein